MNPVMASEDPDGGVAKPLALELRALEVDYGAEPVLRGVDLDVREGEVVALLGPSGCGKTTLLRAVAGFVRPAVGTVRLDGEVVSGPGQWAAPERRHVGLVPQEGALFPHLDVGGNVGFGLSRMTRAARRVRVAESLELVGLGGEERRRPAELSGGQQQRVALARALAPEPAVVLLDEPFSALDATLRTQVRDDVREVLHAAGATAIMVTHDQEEALSFAGRVAVMRDGRLAQVADPVTLYQHPADLGVAEFVGESVRIDGVMVAGMIQTVLGELEYELPPEHALADRPEDGDEVAVALRPEQVVLDSGDGATVKAEVLGSTYFGHDALVRLAIHAGPQEVLARIHRARLPELGATVGIRVDGAVAAFRR
ncbi:MAG: ABC transporter ATP-binding protein [Actinomycetia bacterium]|nr:ABC transporter ATP-binding protein [Actinomycetes bacterium]